MVVAINHNIPALMAINALSLTIGAIQKSLSKLSTGLRVNTASDNADFSVTVGSTIYNLNSAENLTASESRIRDVDMAKEMMNFTKLNILLQAGNSMLGQANMLPQNVLALLR